VTHIYVLKRSFFHAANGIFAKIGRLASKEVILELLKHKCLPVLLYGLEVCELDKRALQSLEFAFNRFFIKLFKTTNVEIVQACREVFHCELPSVQLTERYKKFIGLNDHCDYLQ